MTNSNVNVLVSKDVYVTFDRADKAWPVYKQHIKNIAKGKWKNRIRKRT